MGKRLSKIVTRTGDAGTTGLAGGDRVAKDSARIDAIGTVDELNTHIGVFLVELEPDNRLFAEFRGVQNDLFDLGGELSMPGVDIITAERCDGLEMLIESLNEELEPLTNFILPGGSRVVAQCHVVRAVARRAERTVVHLAAEEPVNPHGRVYLNRLSDLAFVAARWLARSRGEAEILWQQNTRPA